IAGRITLGDGAFDQARVTVRPLFDGPAQTRLADGDGWFGFVHLAPGRYLVRVTLPDGTDGAPAQVVRVTRGGMATADFSFQPA
ncbi:MAG: carboxypeptidase-like regulatory domain-containing protein, partial [Micromonosporaceae bacterium]